MAEQDLKELFQILEIPEPSGEDLELYRVALIHKSTLSDEDEDNPNKHYDRLEFLGDSVLKIVLNQYIYEKHKDYDSGDLTQLSAYLLSDKALARIATRLNIQRFIHYTRRIRVEAILGDVMEALFAATYYTYGYGFTRDWIISLYGDMIEDADQSTLKDNYKAALQELLQGKGHELPSYHEIGRKGPAHDPIFEVEIRLGNMALGSGKGSSKKEAGQAAAQASLEYLEAHPEIIQKS